MFDSKFRVDAWWGARSATPESIVNGIDQTLEAVRSFERSADSWKTSEPAGIWPNDSIEKLAFVNSNVFLTDPDSNGVVEAQPDRGYTISLFPLNETNSHQIISALDFWSGSLTAATEMVFNRVTIAIKKLDKPLTSGNIVRLFESLSSIWFPDFISLSNRDTRGLLGELYTSPRPGLVMWFSDRLPCAPGVAGLGYPRLGGGVLVDLRALVEDSADPIASLTKVYAELEGVGAFDPIPPMSPLKD
ncbi:hypothetical protein [Haematomicrobium sanguinis]|uniref:hypothetical protein n=1 Tax=Haematomicrobium sanguinis TaxID=479106 RepID=UPI0005581022|nr:hypothetical protein [Haematomicrobium sanguinis]